MAINNAHLRQRKKVTFGVRQLKLNMPVWAVLIAFTRKDTTRDDHKRKKKTKTIGTILIKQRHFNKYNQPIILLSLK